MPDYALFALLIGDFLDCLEDQWHTIDLEDFSDKIGRGNTYVYFIPCLPDGMREQVGRSLRDTSGYFGAVEPDLANPLQRNLFYDSLFSFAFLDEGRIHLVGEQDDDEDHVFAGAEIFDKQGIKLISSEESESKRYSPLLGWNPRGLLTLARWEGKSAPQVRERLAAKTYRTFDEQSDFPDGKWKFDEAANKEEQIIINSSKLTDYLLNIQHPKGAGKARFFLEQLEISSEDSCFLRAQFEYQLLMATFYKVGVDQYGLRFTADLPVIGRNAKTATVETGWIMRKGENVNFVTAFPGKKNVDLELSAWHPPIVPLQKEGDEFYRLVFEKAHEAATAAATASIPTPMKVIGYRIIMEGACGSANIRVKDARRGFARWLIKTNNGSSGYKSGAYIHSRVTSQSMDRATAYAEAFAKVLRWHHIECEVQTFID